MSRNPTQGKGDGYKMKAEFLGFSPTSSYLWAQMRSQCFVAKAVSKILVQADSSSLSTLKIVGPGLGV
jgi:hypothetical protein